ncbi:MAG: hypothetical protein RL325_559 [Planctomycetota bacterium]
MDPEAAQTQQRRAAVGRTLLSALHRAVTVADGSIASITTATERREGVRAARRELKAVRAIAPLCRTGANDSTIDGVLEFAAKANQLLGPLRDRDALTRSIHRLSDRFAEGEARRVVRTVLLATLIFGESDRRDDAAFAGAALDRARRSLKQTRAAATALVEDAGFDAGHAAALLARSHRACMEELDAALRSGDLARLHECRKRASFIALACAPFEDEVPAAVRRLRGRARRLASALGEDRDLALLDVEMRVARTQLAGSPLAAAIDDALRLARIEARARVEDAARDFLRLGRGRVKRAIAELLAA